MPDDIPAGNLGKAMLAYYLSDYKEWKNETKKIEIGRASCRERVSRSV